MKGTPISNTRRSEKHSGLRTDEAQHGDSRDGCNGTRQSAIDIFAWNQKLTKHEKDGQLEKAMQLLQQMQQEGTSPDKFTFVQVIKACAGLGRLEDGRLVHKQLIQSGYKSDAFVCNSLVDMYAKCGSIEEAWTVFEKMPSQNVVTWTTIILGHVQCQQGY
jgi:pentatricopeptide repeat protein